MDLTALVLAHSFSNIFRLVLVSAPMLYIVVLAFIMPSLAYNLWMPYMRRNKFLRYLTP